MNLTNRIKALEKKSKQVKNDFIIFCGHKLSTRGIVDDWVTAVMEADADEA